jgi:hypothetical protein
VPERRKWSAADRVACLRWWRRQRTGQRWSFSSGVDELGDAVQPLFVEVVGRAVTQELACHEQCGLRVSQPTTGVGGRSSRRDR